MDGCHICGEKYTDKDVRVRDHCHITESDTINAIPNNMEKYMAFMLGNHLTFIDSFQFMSSSLDKLVSNLPKHDLIYTSEV